MNYKCTFCQIRSFEKLLERHDLPESRKNELTKSFLKWLANIDDEVKIPKLGRDIQFKIREVLNDADPYIAEKDAANSYLLSRYNEFRQMINQAQEPFMMALKLAIAGNIIDFGTGKSFSIDQTINKVVNSPVTVDNSAELMQAISNARNILYLGDNAGEIVLDKLFIETMGHPNVYFAVRGKPVLNDVTKKDANFVDMQDVARVISNGYDAPSTLLEHASPKFLEMYSNADLIISKGMGNLEGLLDEQSKDIFFLLMVKCQVIGDKIGAQTGDVVVRRNNFQDKYRKYVFAKSARH